MIVNHFIDLKSNSKKRKMIQHLRARISFGQIQDVHTKNPESLVTEQLSPKSNFTMGSNLEQKTNTLSNLKSMSKKEKQQLLMQNRQDIILLNYQWMCELRDTKWPLLEKMVLFWHDHFGVKSKSSFATAIHNNTIRKYALGNFADLLKAIAKDPAMIYFLNTQQNKKTAPNENFARELLELFTLGKGNYSEQDIKEAARAFTGWKADRTGSYRFIPFQHDFNSKQFLGETGNFNGEDIIDLILEQPETAQFIVTKLYHYFINDSEIDSELINNWAKYYAQNDYNTSKLLKKMLLSDHFFEKKQRGIKIKSPVEYLLCLQNDFGISINHPLYLIKLQAALSQIILSPPNVSGWPTGKSWINSTSIISRLNIGPAILSRKPIPVSIQNSFDAEDNFNKELQKQFETDAITICLANWENKSITELWNQCNQVIHTSLSDTAKQLLQLPFANKSSIANQFAIRITSLPEYQII